MQIKAIEFSASMKRKERTEEQIIASSDVKAVKNDVCKLRLDEAIQLKPKVLAVSRLVSNNAMLDEYINYAIVTPPKGYVYDSYDLRHVTMDNIQLIFWYKLKENKPVKLFENK